MFKNLSIGLVLCVFSSPSFSAGYVGNGTIRSMQNAYGGWLIYTNGAAINPDGCGKDTIILQSSHGQYKEVYSLLLSAFTAGKPVNINVNGCDQNGYKIFSFVHSVWNN